MKVGPFIFYFEMRKDKRLGNSVKEENQELLMNTFYFRCLVDIQERSLVYMTVDQGVDTAEENIW